MYKIARPFFMVVETPLHAGSGTDLGIVDLPIQRERHTGFPKIEASGLKGCIREAFEEYLIEKRENTDEKEKITFSLQPALKKKFGNGLFDELNGDWKTEEESKKQSHFIKFHQAVSLAFGPEKGDEHAGALGFTDARLLLFPAKSMKGVFAWITCPMVLERFKEDLGLCGIEFKNGEDEKISIPLDNTLKTTDDKGKCLVVNQNELEINGNVILEEYAFEIQSNSITDLAKFLADAVGTFEVNKLVILSNDDFRDFVNLSTEVITRTKINPETGTVQSGALFTEEYLPVETAMYSLALTTPIFNKDKGIFVAKDGKKEEELVMEFFEKGIPEVMQIGGNATIGKGIVKVKVWEDKNE
jgi:CRISPR-associated protein Cmr4